MTLPDETRAKIGVLVVDHSAFMRESIARMVRSDPDLFAVGTARSGGDALEKISALQPDVVTLDVEMGGLDGINTLRGIMARFPRPVVVVSSSTVKGAEITFEALQAGAFDYVPKQVSSSPLDIIHIRHDLIAKIKAAAEARRTSFEGGIRRPPQAETAWNTPATVPAIVAIGTSTGGPKALEEIVMQLPHDLAVPVVVVQHMPVGFTTPFAQRLNTMCPVHVREAADREPLRGGIVYIAPAGIHLTVERSSSGVGFVHLTPEPDGSTHIPSVDVMMSSIASAYGELAMGVILTGMGSDGALGMREIHRRGGLTIGQDESSCIVYGMPRACAELGVLNRLVPLTEISNHILRATCYRRLA